MSIKDIIKLSRRYEKERTKGFRIMSEIEEIDNEIDQIIGEIREIIANLEDSKDKREVNEKFEQYVHLCQNKGIIRK